MKSCNLETSRLRILSFRKVYIRNSHDVFLDAVFGLSTGYKRLKAMIYVGGGIHIFLKVLFKGEIQRALPCGLYNEIDKNTEKVGKKELSRLKRKR